MRRVPGKRLTADQRLVIERAYMAGLDQVTIAALVGKDPSTISRELRRAGSFGTRSPRVRTARAGGGVSREVQREVVAA